VRKRREQLWWGGGGGGAGRRGQGWGSVAKSWTTELVHFWCGATGAKGEGCGVMRAGTFPVRCGKAGSRGWSDGGCATILRCGGGRGVM